MCTRIPLNNSHIKAVLAARSVISLKSIPGSGSLTISETRSEVKIVKQLMSGINTVTFGKYYDSMGQTWWPFHLQWNAYLNSSDKSAFFFI